MRLFFVTDHLSGRGGVETVLCTVSRFLENKGHEVWLLLPHPSENPEWETEFCVRYYDLPADKSVSNLDLVVSRSIGLSSLCADLPNPDVVIGTHTPHTTLYAKMAFGHMDNIPIISWLHNPPQAFHDYHLIRYADLHWCISKGIAEIVQQVVPESTGVHWVANPFELSVENVRVAASSKFVYIGRIENMQKRLDIMFEALAGLQSEWTLEIFGEGPSGDQLKGLAHQLGIASRITWHGWVARPWEQIQEASALLLTSDFEGLPMVIGEALARGLPVIASDCPTGPADFVEEGKNGFLFQPGNVQNLLEKLIAFGSLTPESRRQMGTDARNSMVAFTTEQVVGRMLATVSNPAVRGDRLDY